MRQYRVLGPLEVERDGVVVPLPAAKHRALLLALLLRQGAVTAADQLIDELWPGDQPASAAKLLQTYVSQLRTALGADAIETVPPGYRLAIGPEHPDRLEHIDLCRFERLHDGARRALADGNAELAASLATRAEALWRGPALADVAYEPFAEREAARLEELRLQCVEHRIDADLARGRHEQVVPELAQLCTDHPLRERLHERRALALYRSGRQADALDAIAAARTRLREDLGLDPGPALQDLERAILAQDPALDHDDGPTEAPADHHRAAPPRPAGDLIGREAELAALHEMLGRDHVRLVTVTGAGGSGKTRLAVEVAHRAAPYFANGVALVELASITDPSLVVPALAQALGLAETADQPPAAVVADWLRTRQLLLVVDNLEHLVDAAPDLVALLAHAPLVTLLVTSRRVLHVTGEHVFPLGPLALDAASHLFALRAAARDPSVRVDAGDDAVRDICTRLDCLPLAIEIAAARTVALDPASMRDRLRTSISALGPGPRDAPARQQTLADTIRWSTDLLDDDERRALARFSVFVGGCDVATAESICDADLDTIVGLVDSSLLQRGGPGRLGILETVREHAGTLLDELGERADAEAAHADWCLALARRAAPGASQPETLQAIDPDLDNLRRAYDRAQAEGDHERALRLATELYPYWYVRGLYREGRDRIASALAAAAAPPPDDLHAAALRVLASMQYLLGDDDDADPIAADAIRIGMGRGALEPAMASYTVRGLIATRRGDFDAARRHLLASADVARTLGRDVDVNVCTTNLAEIALVTGDLDEAHERYEQALAFHDGHGTDPTFALIGLGHVARRRGDVTTADERFAAARAHAEGAGRRHNALQAMLGQARVAADRGDIDAAGRLLAEVDDAAAAMAVELVGSELEDHQAVQAVVNATR